MKKRLTAVIASIALLSALQTFSQPTPNVSDTAKRPPLASPRDSIVATTASGVTITMTYGSPAVKGRTIGNELEPREDSIWRAGANEATTFEVNKDVTIEGKKLPAGRYALFTKKHGNEWTFIFNRTWQTWGAYSYKQNKVEDALQVTTTQMKETVYNERLKYHIDPKGMVHLYWGNLAAGFTVR